MKSDRRIGPKNTTDRRICIPLFTPLITVCTKVVKIYPSKTVLNQQGRTNTVAEVFIQDETKTMQLDLWNEQISQVQENHVYRFTNLSATGTM